MEESMSVWPDSLPGCPLLTGREGELVQVRIDTDPRLLEDLLECLSERTFSDQSADLSRQTDDCRVSSLRAAPERCS